MSDPNSLSAISVEEVLKRWPETADVFNRRNMACVGCPVAPFYTVKEAAAVYNLSPDSFIEELEEAISEARRRK